MMMLFLKDDDAVSLIAVVDPLEHHILDSIVIELIFIYFLFMMM